MARNKRKINGPEKIYVRHKKTGEVELATARYVHLASNSWTNYQIEDWEGDMQPIGDSLDALRYGWEFLKVADEVDQ